MAGPTAPGEGDPGAEGAPEIVPLALLDGYKVRWSRETVARDIVQNFFDEVADFREVAIDVDAAAGAIEVRGPSVFDFDYMRYLGGTTKRAPERRAAGGFGEGLKVCALVLLRDHRCAMTAGAGAWEARALLRPMKLGRELCYELRRLPEGGARAGSFVRIEGADRRLCEAFAAAKDLFRHPENPRLAQPIHVDEAAGVGVYAPRVATFGHLFYRRQHRGTMRFGDGGALTFCFDDRIPRLEGDRDRRNLAAGVPLVAALAERLPDEIVERLIRHLRAYWKGGSSVLGVLAAEAARRGLRLAFPRRWLARVKDAYTLHEHAERRGFHLGVERLAAIGMPSVEERFGGSTAPRPATPIEGARMKVARDLYARLAGEPPIHEAFRVEEVAAGLLAEMSRRACVVPARALAAPFGDGITACLAALATTTGVRARRNADRLTALLEGAVRLAGALGPYAQRWDEAALDPSREGPAPPAWEEEEGAPARRNGGRPITITVLAPEGMPGAAELAARLRRICDEERVDPWLSYPRVNGPCSAAASYARGVPSVWIGGVEVEAPRRGGPAYKVRSFARPDGGRALWPDDDALRPLVRDAAARSERALRRGRYRTGDERHRALGAAALRRWLRAHAPEDHARLAAEDAVAGPAGEARRAARPGFLEEALAVARKLAERDLIAGGDPARFAEAAPAAMGAALGRVRAACLGLEARAPGVLEDTPAARAALAAILGRVLAQIGAGADAGDALAGAAEHAAPLLSLCQAADGAPLDERCAGVCLREAMRVYQEAAGAPPATGEGPAGSAGPAALALARARLDAAVERAIARHDERDAEGQPLGCEGLYAELSQRFRPAEAAAIQAGREGGSVAARAVRAAWDAAIAEGCTELEAAARCLAAALPFDRR